MSELDRSLPENLPPAPDGRAETVDVRHGMFGAHGTGDTSGYGGLVGPVQLPGATPRPDGGWLSDRIGGYRLLLGLLMVVASALAIASTLPPLPAVIAVLFIALGCLGMGNGAVFQLVPQRFADRMGLVTGIVGAAGGLGGFFLPSMLGAIKDATGSYGPGLLLLAGGFAGGAFALLQLGSVWHSRWQPDIVRRSGVFCYKVAVRGSRVRGSA